MFLQILIINVYNIDYDYMFFQKKVKAVTLEEHTLTNVHILHFPIL